MLSPQRTVEELKELRSLTGDENGAQRVAFTDTWAKARQFLLAKVANLPVTTHQDEAGNLWITLRGKSDRSLILGGHLDSVPNGGWLDGCLNVLASVEVLRALAAQGTPDLTIHVVDWADEEGARFGRSLFGSSACSGAFDPIALGKLTDKQGITLREAAGKYGINLDHALEAGKGLAKVAAYLELHIEQGPVLESMGLPLGVVLGTFGVERHAITFTGQAAHSGSTPMSHRRDALAGVSKLHLAVREIAVRHEGGGVCTVGSVITEPGIVTAIVGNATMTLDQRHLDPEKLASMLAEAKVASEKIAAEEKLTVEWKKIWSIQPFPFHPELIELGEQAVMETTGTCLRLPSGPLHDAAEICRTGIPTLMLFVQSLYGISHNKIEDTREEDLRASVEAFYRLTTKTLQWAQSRA